MLCKYYLVVRIKSIFTKAIKLVDGEDQYSKLELRRDGKPAWFLR